MIAAAGSLSLAAVAPAATVTAQDAVARSCHERYVGGAAKGVDVQRVTATQSGLVQARLAGGGDWDLGVFDAETRRTVAGSAGFRSAELAEGFVTKGQELVVQACRYRGEDESARVTVDFLAVPQAASDEKVQVVEVDTRDAEAKRRLQGLGLDLTEHGTATTVQAVLYGEDDAAKLRRAGFTYDVEIADLGARSEANRRADRAFAAQTTATDLPSGRDSYRRLADYELELKELAQRYPALVRPLTLNHRTIEGREVYGIEITRNPNRVNDGKPIFLNMGVHHAREWPSSEHSMEFAYDLLTNYGRGVRTTELIEDTRTIVVPIVNPDGFNISREGSVPPGAGRFSTFSYEYKRKNCRISASTPDDERGFRTGTCADNPAGRLRGTDPNRNYGGFWGGPGASPTWSSDIFRGDEPFSEPEIQNIRELQATRTITNLITNHTYSNLVLRPPGVADVGFPLDEPAYRELGARMTSHNAYRNIPSFQLYDTTGTTEDWTFWTAGSLGFTFEIGPEEFHPPFETGVVAEYLGREPAAGAGQGGNQAAYYEMLEATADSSLHSRITGRAPEGNTLELSKSFMTSTSPVFADPQGNTILDPIQFEDRLAYTLDTPGRRFEWHVNPSTRPVVAGRSGRDPVAPPQATITLANPEGQPAENPNPNYTQGPYEAVPFTIVGPPEADNGKVTIDIEFGNAATDWDLYVVNEAGEIVTSSAGFGDTDEEAVLFDPPAGNYVAHVVNYAQVAGQPFDDWRGEVRFESPRPTTIGEKESWTLTCRDEDGDVRSTRQVVVDRGQTVNVGRVCRRR